MLAGCLAWCHKAVITQAGARCASEALQQIKLLWLPQEVERQLEQVYAAAPVPEEYMKYQLHMRSGLEVAAIDKWFHARRSRDASSGGAAQPAAQQQGGGQTCNLHCANAQE